MSPTPIAFILQTACPEAVSLIESMLQLDPKQRPSASQCLQHPFFQGPMTKPQLNFVQEETTENLPRLPKQTAKDFMQQQNENIMQPSNQQKFAYTRKPQMKPGIIKAPMMAPSSRFSRLSTLKYVY